jgi:hypothetical protein
LALDLSTPELNFILTLSNTNGSVQEDPLDELVTLSDEALEAVLKNLESAPIRS